MQIRRMSALAGALSLLSLLAMLESTVFAQDTGGGVEGAKTQHDIVYAKTDSGAELKLDIYTPADIAADKAMPVIIRISPARETPARPAGELLKKGYALVYAGYLPDSAPQGTVFNHFPADLHAVKAAIRWTRASAQAQHFDPDKIALWGADDGATLAALATVTPDQKDLNGSLGDHPDISTAVRAVCLFGGTTDWRNAELYGDETVNILGSPAYQLFGGNPKEFPEAARLASAVNYIRPSSPATLMVTLASDNNRAMHLIFAETLRRAGVASALYEEKPGTGAGTNGRAVNEASLDQTILAFFNDTLASAPATQPATTEDEIQHLIKAGLYKQARRIIEEQVALAAPNGREPWLKLIRQVATQQQEPALKRLAEAIKSRNAKTENMVPPAPHVQWTLREVLTDPEHIGEYQVEALLSQYDFDLRAHVLAAAETLNALINQKDWTAADRQMLEIRAMAAGEGDAPTINEILNHYSNLRAHPDQLWPQGTKPIPFANNFGQDLYGNWFDIKAGGVIQRFRYIPPGKFFMGSSTEEWGRLPGEPILEPTEIKNGFWMAESLVPQAMWEGVMGKEENHSHFRGLNLPAESLSYAHAINFLDKLNIGARLPTEAEYEYATRAGATQPYAGTGRLSDIAWFWDEKREGSAASEIRILHELETDQTNLNRSTHDVKTKLPNRWGLYDMQGDVWEWCSGTSPNRPPNYHVARGGSWLSIPQNCRAARSAWFPTEEESWNLGLRIVIPAQ